MLKVLIAEGDPMIADMAEDFLVGCGYEVCGIARTVEEAVALGLMHRPDLLVVDLRLADGGLGTEIPGRLTALGRVEVLYATGNMLLLLQNGADGDACLSRLYGFATTAEEKRHGLGLVRRLVAQLRGTAKRAFDHGTVWTIRFPVAPTEA